MEDLEDQVEDLKDEEQELIDQQIENSIKSFKVHIDIVIDTAEAERDWNKFREKVIRQVKEDDFLGQSQTNIDDFYTYYNQGGTGEIQELTGHINDTIAELKKMEAG